MDPHTYTSRRITVVLGYSRVDLETLHIDSRALQGKFNYVGKNAYALIYLLGELWARDGILTTGRRVLRNCPVSWNRITPCGAPENDLALHGLLTEPVLVGEGG